MKSRHSGLIATDCKPSILHEHVQLLMKPAWPQLGCLAGYGTSAWISVTPLQRAADLASHHTMPPAVHPKPCRHQYFLVFFTSGTQGNPPWIDAAIHRIMVLLATPFSDTKKCWSGKKKVASVLLDLLANLLPHIVIKLLVMLTKSSLDQKQPFLKEGFWCYLCACTWNSSWSVQREVTNKPEPVNVELGNNNTKGLHEIKIKPNKF